jgi:tellurite resistance protein
LPANDSTLIGKVLRQLSRPPSFTGPGVKDSILVASAAAYGATSEDDLTQPTGFDPEVARLFEAIVESAFLVANADGEFDATEQQAFEHVVLSACDGRVAERQIHALLADLGDQLAEDGVDKRIDMVARSIAREDHGQEVLRVAALLAHVSGGVSEVERSVLERLAKALHLNASATASALSDVATALAD